MSCEVPSATEPSSLLQERTSLPVDGEEVEGAMLVVGGQASAGAGFNVVSASAWFCVDRRFNPEEELDSELDRLKDIITGTAVSIGAQVEIDVLHKQPSGNYAPLRRGPCGIC